MRLSRLPLLISAALAVPTVLAVSPAAAAAPVTTFGSHVSSCAQLSGGFDGQHNPSHHRGPDAVAMEPVHC